MARGFESKDVEFQQAEVERRSKHGKGLTAAERESLEKRRSLELALAKTRADRENATHPRHRQMLDGAIAALERELARSLKP
ncbi:MAG: hypothetical protein AB7F99_17570 [Vicinamibacterales bacterium]